LKLYSLLKRPKYWLKFWFKGQLKSLLKKVLKRYFPAVWRSSHSVKQFFLLSNHTQGFELWLDHEFGTMPSIKTSRLDTNYLDVNYLETSHLQTNSQPELDSTSSTISSQPQTHTTDQSLEKNLGSNSVQTALAKLEVLRIEPSGVVTISGWQLNPTILPKISLKLNDQLLPAIEAHRCYRPDVRTWLKDWLTLQDLPQTWRDRTEKIADALTLPHHFLGFAIEFNLTDSLNQDWLTLELNDQPIWSGQITYAIHPPHYSELLTTRQVLHRDNIYGYGPPSPTIAADVMDLLTWVTSGMGSILDFGCGRGNIVELLRSQGIIAQGLELDRPEIRAAIAPETAPHIRLYDGVFPLTEDDDQFDCTVSIEVIEHIPEFRTALAEIARITRHRFVLTVPDISAIPRCFPANVVPWHLLESTHYNFFNENSLRSELEAFWNSIQIVKFGENAVNSSRFCTSVIAICEQKK